MSYGATGTIRGKREWMETLLSLLGHGHHRCCRLRWAAGAFGIVSRLAPALDVSPEAAAHPASDTSINKRTRSTLM